MDDKKGFVSYVQTKIFEEPISAPKYDKNSQYRINKYNGTISIYNIICPTCSKLLFEYQKDAAGPLLRCYDDRIINKFEYFKITIEDELGCGNCNTIISKPQSIYKKINTELYHEEERLAYEMKF